MNKGTLYLIPNSLNDNPISTEWFYTEALRNILIGIKNFVIETPKKGRFALKDIEGLKVFEKTFFKIDENSSSDEYIEVINLLKKGEDVAVISDSGMPGIADMGTRLVLMAHMNDINVKSYGNTSAILDTLVRSGLSGQYFQFNGYLSKIPDKRRDDILKLERDSLARHITHIFIETPYRAQYMFDDLLSNLNNNTFLTVGVDVQSSDEILKTKSIAEWRSNRLQITDKRVVFILNSK